MKRPPLFAQFDGEDIAGTRYGLGDEIDASVPGAILDILSDQGRISANKPTVITAPLVGSDKAVEDMSRSELEGSALSIMSTRILSMPSDDLREAIERSRAQDADGAKEDAPTEGEGTNDPDPAKPLAQQTTAELKATAAAEEITFGDEVKTNPDRVKAIEAARAAKANGAPAA